MKREAEAGVLMNLNKIKKKKGAIRILEKSVRS
jgi:hypothetical protein